jgi:hypothetical protein
MGNPRGMRGRGGMGNFPCPVRRAPECSMQSQPRRAVEIIQANRAFSCIPAHSRARVRRPTGPFRKFPGRRPAPSRRGRSPTTMRLPKSAQPRRDTTHEPAEKFAKNHIFPPQTRHFANGWPGHSLDRERELESGTGQLELFFGFPPVCSFSSSDLNCVTEIDNRKASSFASCHR